MHSCKVQWQESLTPFLAIVITATPEQGPQGHKIQQEPREAQRSLQPQVATQTDTLQQKGRVCGEEVQTINQKKATEEVSNEISLAKQYYQPHSTIGNSG